MKTQLSTFSLSILLRLSAVGFAAVVLTPAYPAVAAEESTSASIPADQLQGMVQRATDYLRLRGQAADGSFSQSSGVGVTAVVAAGLTAVGRENDQATKKAFEYLLKHVQPDGGIYSQGSTHANYETCIAVMALSQANKSGEYTEILKNADRFIRKGQWDEDEGIAEEDLNFGGAGYGSKARPDLSNTAFMVEALRQLGAEENDPAIQKALLFVTRCQNLESEQNSSPFAAKVDDGGFYYTVAAGGASMAGQNDDGGLRSYPAMTYAGLKSMIYAGLTEDDPRVSAAKKFLANNYSVETNPGLGQSGLFYYYQTMAKALKANGEAKFDTASGERDWKQDLFTALKDKQREDGSWVNEDQRWMESDPNLVTGYALLTLATLTNEK